MRLVIQRDAKILTSYTKYNIIGNSKTLHLDDNLKWLSKWYSYYCDGEWEYSHGIRIVSKQSKWEVGISIHETEMENQPFENISIKRSDYDWIECFISGFFEVHCGLDNLPEAIAIFRNWVEQVEFKEI